MLEWANWLSVIPQWPMRLGSQMFSTYLPSTHIDLGVRVLAEALQDASPFFLKQRFGVLWAKGAGVHQVCSSITECSRRIYETCACPLTFDIFFISFHLKYIYLSAKWFKICDLDWFFFKNILCLNVTFTTASKTNTMSAWGYPFHSPDIFLIQMFNLRTIIFAVFERN